MTAVRCSEFPMKRTMVSAIGAEWFREPKPARDNSDLVLEFVHFALNTEIIEETGDAIVRAVAFLNVYRLTALFVLPD